jgi:hypothetical protein
MIRRRLAERQAELIMRPQVGKSALLHGSVSNAGHCHERAAMSQHHTNLINICFGSAETQASSQSDLQAPSQRLVGDKHNLKQSRYSFILKVASQARGEA